jgi:hypothetical protein
MDFNIVYKNLRNNINTTGSTFDDAIENILSNGITYESGDLNSLSGVVGTIYNEGMYVISGVESYLKLAEAGGAGAPTGFNMDVEMYLKLEEAIGGNSGTIYPSVFGYNLGDLVYANHDFGVAGFSPKPISKDSVPFIPSVSKIFDLISDNTISNSGIVEYGYKRVSKEIASMNIGELWEQGVPGVLPSGTTFPYDSNQQVEGVFEIYTQEIAGFSILPRIIKDFSTNKANFEALINAIIDKGLIINYYTVTGQNGERFQRYSFGSVENYMQMLEV